MRRFLLGAAVVMLDVLWLGAWLRWLAASGAPGARPPGLLAMSVIALVAFALGTAGSRASGGLRALRAGSLLIGLTVTVLMARFVLYPFYAPGDMGWIGRLASEISFGTYLSSARLLVVAAVFLWWRGLRVGSSVITPTMVRRRVYITIGALVVLAALVRVTHPVSLESWVVAAAVCSLTALALSRLEDASTGYGGTAADFGPTWVGLTISAVAFIVAAAAVLASLLSVEAARALARALWPLPQVLIRILLLALATVVGWVATAGDRAMSWLASLLGPADDTPLAVPQSDYPQATEGWADLLHMLPFGVVFAMQMTALAIVVAIIAYWLSRALRRAYERGGRKTAGEHGSDLSTARVLGDAIGLARAAIAAGVSVLGGMRPGAGGVRALYARLLEAMAERGLARQPSDTPYEYQAVPTGALPAVGDEIAELTEAYVRERYGSQGLSEPRLQALRQAWRRIRRAARDAD